MLLIFSANGGRDTNSDTSMASIVIYMTTSKNTN